jgi:hypothetical protein
MSNDFYDKVISGLRSIGINPYYFGGVVALTGLYFILNREEIKHWEDLTGVSKLNYITAFIAIGGLLVLSLLALVGVIKN